MDVPFEINREMLEKLSKKAKLNPNQTQLAAISSALRTWKELNEKDVKLLFNLIHENEKAGRLIEKTLSTEEVYQILERDIEKFIARYPEMLGTTGTFVEKQQFVFSDESRLDLLLSDPKEDCKIVIEIKKGKVGREAIKQIKHYMKLCVEELGYKNVKGIIVCDGILPYYENELLEARKENIFVTTYGWKLQINK